MSGSKTLALSGGVGGAKLVLGLANVLDTDELLAVANTGDDFEHLGLSISPDVDTLMYTLAGVNDKQQGWGLADETWHTMQALEAIGSESWFRLGDRDLATHLERTRRLSDGDTLTDVTHALCQRFGVNHRVVPMTDDPVRTIVQLATDTHDMEGATQLGFQEYFVREQCRPKISGLRFDNVEQARPQPEMLRLMNSAELSAVVVCPSNPFVSIDPILHLPNVRRSLEQCRAPVVAVSPILAGAAVKGPTAKMMRELNMPITAVSVARYYADFIDGFVLDEADRGLLPAIEELGLAVCCTKTLMHTLQDRIELARIVLNFCQTLETDNSPAKLAVN